MHKRLFALALAISSPALAHDYWMVPTAPVAPRPSEIGVSVFVGEGFVAEEERRFEPERFTRASVHHLRQVDDLLSHPVPKDSAPAFRVPTDEEGGYLLVVDRNLARIELEPAKFEAYLREEGLERVVAERARRGESQKPGRERYTRYLKALVQIGSMNDASYGTIAGQTLELVPDENPSFVQPGSELGVRVRFHGEPLAGATLDALSRDGDDIRSARYVTSPTGEVRVKIDRRGVWLLRMVHMVRFDEGTEVDWESFWASYTFATLSPTGEAVLAPSMFPRARTSPWIWAGSAIAVAVVLAAGFRVWRRGGRP